MTATKKYLTTKHVVAPILLLLAASVCGESLTFIGKVKSKLPQVVITNTDEPVSDAKEFTLGVNVNAGVCSISSNVVTAMNHGSTPICKIEWDDPQGLVNYLAGLRGVVAGEGDHVFTYTLKMFDQDKFETFHTAQYSVTFQAPIPPDAATFNSTWKIREQSSDTVHQIYNRNEENFTVEANVTERNYVQVIKFGELSCSIPAGQNTCVVTANETFVEAPDQGEKVVDYGVSDPYQYFTPVMDGYTYQYDFRPPQIVDVHVNADAQMLPMVLNQYEQTVVLYSNQAAVVVESPHESEDPLFLPTDPSLTITQNKTLYVTNTVNYGGVNVTFDLGNPVGEASISVDPINEPLRLGTNLLYVYDFSHIKDGLYDFEFSTLDGNNNGSTKSVENVYVDRNAPDIQFMVNGQQFKSSSRASVFSLSDLTILTWGGWADGSKLVSVNLNGEPITFNAGTDNVKRLDNLSLERNSLNTLEVFAEDAVGNQVSKFFDFKFSEYEFNESVNVPLAEVEPVRIELHQTRGLYCVMFSGVELARIYSSNNAGGVTRGCTVEWLAYPAQLDVTMPTSESRAKSLVASGIINTPGKYPYHFIIHSHDAYGSSLPVYESNGDIVIADLAAPTINVGNPHIYNNYPADYKYPLASDYNLTIRTSIDAAPHSELVVELYDQSNTLVEKQEFEDASETTRTYFRTDNNFTPLTAFAYRVRAYYKNRPDLYSEKPYHFFTTPGHSVRLHLEHESTMIEGSELAIIAKMGNRSADAITYDASMGTWNVGLYRYDTILQRYEPLHPLVKTNAEGVANLVLAADEMIQNENRIIAIASLDTPYAEIDIERKANSLYNVPVLSISGISAQLTGTDFSAPIPARFVSRLDYETALDKNTAGEIVWQTSIDGLEWVEVARKYGLTNYLVSIDEPGEIFVRATVESRLTGEIYYTNVVKYVGYQEAVLEFSGDRTVATGAIGKYGYILNEYGAENLSGTVEWSTDNKTTWQAMSENELLQIDNAIDLHTRALIAPPELAPYYIYDKLTVNVIPPRQLSTIFRSSAYKAEVGDDVTLNATFVNSSLYTISDYRYQIVHPDGNVTEALELVHTITESDFVNDQASFIFRSWVDGMELQTISTRTVNIRKIVYSGLPDTSIYLQTPERVNYSDVTLRLIKPQPSELPSSVEISQDVILPEDGSLALRQIFGSSAKLIAKREGVHPIRVRFYDNRGNEREHTVFVTILSPPPMELKMGTNFFGDFLRPPMRLTNSLRFKFGSPNDRFDYVEWYINEELVDTDQRSIKQQIFTEPGEFTIKARVVSEFGQEAEVSETFTLEPNQPPVCEPYWEQRDRVSTLHANCKDFDGKIVRVGFTYAYSAQEMSTVYRYYSPSIAFIEGLYDPTVPITLEAFDDSDEVTEMTLDWPEGAVQ